MNPMLRKPYLPTLMAIALSACITSVQNNQRLCSRDVPVPLAGYLMHPSMRVIVQASPQPDMAGPGWTDVGTTLSAATVAWTLSGQDYYYWDAGSVVIPPALWGTAGGERVTYLRAFIPGLSAGEPYYLTTFDTPETSASGTDWFTCSYQTASRDGKPFHEGALACSSASKPVIRITAPMVSTCPCPSSDPHTGDLVLRDPAQLEEERCTSEVLGDLIVEDAPGLDTVRLEHLRRVTGDLRADLAVAPGGALPNRRLELPQLAQVDEGVFLHVTGAPGATTAVDVGLPALASIGAEVEVIATGGAVTVAGMPAVTALPQSLTFELAGDAELSGLLPALARVTGAVSIRAGAGLEGALPGLVEVGGSLILTHDAVGPRADGVGLARVERIGGDLVLLSTPWAELAGAQPALGALASVAGVVTLQSTRFTSFRIGRDDLRVGGLQLADNPALAELPLRGVVVDALGAIGVLDNAALPTCEVELFIDAQAELGWAGDAFVDGNDDAAVCP